jgi:sugar phosphate isomerase/epimerase
MCSAIHSAHVRANRQTRRDFIRQLGSTAALGAAWLPVSLAQAEARSAAAPKTLVGSNIYGWGQYAQRENRKLDVEEVISALRDTGYDYLEAFLNADKPDEIGKFAEQLKAKGLQPVSLYTGARLHEAAKASAVVAKLLSAAKLCQPDSR